MRLKFRLGWIPDVPDQRDIPFTAVFRIPRKLPPRVDLRAGCSPVEAQGNLGSCTAQALVGALEFLEVKALGASQKSQVTDRRSGTKDFRPSTFPVCGKGATCPDPEVLRARDSGRRGDLRSSRFQDLSRLFVYYNERLAMGTVREDSGAMLRTGIKVLKKRGVCRETLWPYNLARFTVRPSAPCYTEALRHQVTAYQRLETLAEMKACLAMGLPFVFGFAVYAHVMSDAVKRSGKIRLPKPRERMVGGHAVMAIGYRDRTRSLLLRNSWGADWGQDGYGEIPYAYLESRNLSDDCWCIQGTESDCYAALRK